MAGADRMFVGISGGTCSGKTTLEFGLRQRLGDELAIISFDDMTISRPVLEAAGIEVSDWDDPGLFRWDALRGHLADLRAGRPTTVDSRSWESRRDGVKEKLILPSPIICLSGFLALYDVDIAASFDLSIFIDIPENELVRRRLTRDNQAHNRQPYIDTTLLPAHRRLVLPQRERAMYVLDGTAPREEVADKASVIIRRARGPTHPQADPRG